MYWAGEPVPAGFDELTFVEPGALFAPARAVADGFDNLDQINPVPGRNKNMHTPQFNDSVHASFTCEQRQFLLFFRIGHTQTQCLHVAIEFRNRLHQIVHFQHCQGFTLNRFGKVRSRAEQQRPVRTRRKDCPMSRIVQQPGCPCLANR